MISPRAVGEPSVLRECYHWVPLVNRPCALVWFRITWLGAHGTFTVLDGALYDGALYMDGAP